MIETILAYLVLILIWVFLVGPIIFGSEFGNYLDAVKTGVIAPMVIVGGGGVIVLIFLAVMWAFTVVFQ